jgi:quercetin dioxygenase-like cupin family protein
MPYTLRLFADTLAPDAKPAPLPAANRVLYVVKGAAEVEVGGNVARLTRDGSGFSSASMTIAAGAQGADVLRWELTGDPEPDDGTLKGAKTKRLLAAPVSLDTGAPYLIRLDSIELGVGGKAPKHVHQGPGIRCLLEGGFTVETQGHTNSYKPGEAWFETGPDPVVAWAPEDKNAKFVRVMLLPRALLGKMSTRYLEANPAVATQGRRWQIYFDRAIEP